MIHYFTQILGLFLNWASGPLSKNQLDSEAGAPISPARRSETKEGAQREIFLSLLQSAVIPEFTLSLSKGSEEPYLSFSPNHCHSERSEETNI